MSRNANIVWKVLHGKTLKDVATEYGISPPRVHQIMVREIKRCGHGTTGTWLEDARSDAYTLSAMVGAMTATQP